MNRRRLAVLLASTTLAIFALPGNLHAYWASDYFHRIDSFEVIRPPELTTAMREAEARSNEQRAGQAPRLPPTPAIAPPFHLVPRELLARSNFRPIFRERARMFDALVAVLPENLGPRAVQRVRIEQWSNAVDKALEGERCNLAKMTFLLVAMSLQNSTGQALAPETSRRLMHSIAESFARNETIRHLDNRQRSEIYYLFEATLALETGLTFSTDPKEQLVGQELSRATLLKFAGVEVLTPNG